MNEKYTSKDISQFLRAANADLALGKYKAKDMIPDYCKAVLIGFQLQADLATAKKENNQLKEFARHVIETECWSLIPQDGGDLQDLAEKLGLIVPHTATEQDIDDECDHEVGDRIFKFSETLKGE